METPTERDDQPVPGSDSASSTPSTILTEVWESMAEILGTAATATLIRRAAERGAGKMPNLTNLEISRDNLVRYYKVPESWRAPDQAQAVLEVSTLLDELRPLLARLTGQIVVRRIDAIAAGLATDDGQGA